LPQKLILLRKFHVRHLHLSEQEFVNYCIFFNFYVVGLPSVRFNIRPTVREVRCSTSLCA